MEMNNSFNSKGTEVITDLLIVGGGMAAAQLVRRLAHHGFGEPCYWL